MALINKRTVVFTHDIIMIPLAWLGAFWLRFNMGQIPEEYLSKSQLLLPLIIIIQTAFYWSLGLYRGVWRFASLPDLIRILRAVSLGVLSVVLLLFLSQQLSYVPRSIFPLYGLLLIVFLGSSRFLYRLYKDRGAHTGKRVLVVGAGRAGEGIVRDMQRDVNKEYHAVAFVDDDHAKQGRDIHGIRVLGDMSQIPNIVKRYHIDLIIIAIPSAPSSLMRSIVSYCESTRTPFRTLPGLNDLVKGNVKIDVLREVILEDLLGRSPVSLDWDGIRNGLQGKTILVSGGGGSIGSELCRQIALLAPKTLVVVEQNEFNLYSLGIEFNQKFPTIDFVGYLCDVSDEVAVRNIFERHRIELVFHAAAYKHVPMLENQVRIAVKNNIGGTQTLANLATRYSVEKFVLISTDKAVNPTNIMGATKRAAEIFCQNLNAHSKVQFITVRFGNVLGSAGSVVPLFRKQIKEGGPVTVTHPEITRFFMTIPEASQLILQATVLGKGGEIFVLDMGEPVKISYLAEQMIRLTGLKPHKEIEIQYTGLRPGEKLYEELFYKSEALVPTSHQKIMQASYCERAWEELNGLLKDIKAACEQNDVNAIQTLLFTLVPEYSAAEL